MFSRTQISAFVGLSICYWLAALGIQGEALNWTMLAPFGSVVGAVSLTLLLFEHVAWKWPLINGMLIKRPILHGTWRVTLQSNWVDPKTKKTIAPIVCYLVCRQTASKLSMRLLTQESSSQTVSAGIELCTDETFEISCTYRNKPKSQFRYRSEVHYGAMLLQADSRNPETLEGEYWTDRKTTGTVVMSDRANKTVMTFIEAEQLF